ncbi:och1 [Candida margitis]|uniref:och1 n=1 Tax=Candida margitis TaxID=1775924 RepID=UPI002227089D|nr:och1 [Candida margitis]KAI5968609.1 och1 [Candida margitis]
MTKYHSSSNNKGRKILIGTILISLVVITITFFSGSLTPAKDLQGVISSLPNDKLSGLSNFLSSENSRNQDELLNKIEKLNKKLFQAQEAKINKLEEQNKLILKELKLLKTPPSSASIREKLTYLYPYDSESKFPAYIWQSWKHGLNDGRFEERFRQGESQWAYKNPGFVHELFNDDTAHTMIRHLYQQVPEVLETFEMLPEVIMKMDFFKYLILYAKGGVYADIDTYPLQPVPNWTPENVSPLDIGVIIGIESDSSSPDWRKEQIRRLQFGQFVIQAKPGHPILREAISQVIEHTNVKKLENLASSGAGGSLRLTGNTNEKSLTISQWTGSAIWTDVVFKYFNDYIQSSVFQKVTWKEFHNLKTPKLVSDILVLPSKSFASDVEEPKDGKIEDPLAFVKHYAAKIWKSG